MGKKPANSCGWFYCVGEAGQLICRHYQQDTALPGNSNLALLGKPTYNTSMSRIALIILILAGLVSCPFRCHISVVSEDGDVVLTCGCCSGPTDQPLIPDERSNPFSSECECQNCICCGAVVDAGFDFARFAKAIDSQSRTVAAKFPDGLLRPSRSPSLPIAHCLLGCFNQHRSVGLFCALTQSWQI